MSSELRPEDRAVDLRTLLTFMSELASGNSRLAKVASFGLIAIRRALHAESRLQALQQEAEHD